MFWLIVSLIFSGTWIVLASFTLTVFTFSIGVGEVSFKYSYKFGRWKSNTFLFSGCLVEIIFAFNGNGPYGSNKVVSGPNFQVRPLSYAEFIVWQFFYCNLLIELIIGMTWKTDFMIRQACFIWTSPFCLLKLEFSFTSSASLFASWIFFFFCLISFFCII